MSELKPLPCPWCAELPVIEAGIPVVIRCMNDDCRVYSELCADSLEEVISIWNTRPTSPALARLKEEVERAPHEKDCKSVTNSYYDFGVKRMVPASPCTCFKSRALQLIEEIGNE